MKSNPIRDKKYLDGEKLFIVYWQEMGEARSTIRLQAWCLSHSIVNPKSQNVPTRMGLWKAMWRWATENKDKAYKIWVKACDSENEEYPEYSIEWNKIMLKNSKSAFQNVTHKKAYYNAQ